MRAGSIASTLLRLGFILPLFCTSAEGQTSESGADPLAALVAAGREDAGWEHQDTSVSDGHTVHTLRLCSGSWRTPEEVNRVLWKHDLVIYAPETAPPEPVLLWIGSGQNAPGPAPGPGKHARSLAELAGLRVAELRQVPNQPLDFGDGKPRVEDDLLAYSWARLLEGGDESWPAQIPMARSGIVAMDALQEFLGSEDGGGEAPESFIVCGASKRGWTSWLVAALDTRVRAVAPIVIDILDLEASMRHHHAAYGFFAPAVGDYVRHGVPDWLGHERFERLVELVDPFERRRNLTLPKYLINASGDQFFLPDSSRFYYKQLTGEKAVRYLPNADHSLGGTDALASLATWCHLVAADEPRPSLRWTDLDYGVRDVTANPAPTRVRRWSAHNPAARDFRVESVGRIWAAAEEDAGSEIWMEKPPEVPASGYAASFLEFTWSVPGHPDLVQTTPVRVVPDILPHAGELEQR